MEQVSVASKPEVAAWARALVLNREVLSGRVNGLERSSLGKNRLLGSWPASRPPLRDAGDDWDGIPGALPLANFPRPCGTFAGAWLGNVVEGEGVIKFLTVRSLTCSSGRL